MKRTEEILFWAWATVSWMWAASVVFALAEPLANVPPAAVPLFWLVVVALGPPALALGLGLVGVWIIRGHHRLP
jgi:hypothetical protein